MTTCANPACSNVLDADAVARWDARHCRPACRVAAHKSRRLAEISARVDTLERILAELVSPILRNDTTTALGLVEHARDVVDSLRP